MTREEAAKIQIGSEITVGGRAVLVSSVKVQGMAAPFFRGTFQDSGEGLTATSYRICGVAR